MFPSIAIILKKMGVTLFSKSSMDFFYSAVKKIKDEHKESEVCLSLFHCHSLSFRSGNDFDASVFLNQGRVDFLLLMLQNQIPGDHFEDTAEQPAKGLRDRPEFTRFGLFHFTCSLFSNMLFCEFDRTNRPRDSFPVPCFHSRRLWDNKHHSHLPPL